MNKILNKFFLSIVCGALFLSTVLAVYAVQVGGAGNANGEVVGDLKLASAGALQTGVTAANTALLQAYDTDGAVYATFMTLTANDTPTGDLASTVTSGGETILTSSFTGSGSVTTTGTITSGGLGTGSVIGTPTMTLGSDADGDMYYRASNILTRLAKGTEGQVLTMNTGATAPEWATAAGGGASPYDATVGSAGADYLDVQAAIAGGKSNLLLITSVTEDSDVTVSTRLNIHLVAGVTLTMGDYNFVMSGNEVLTITGEGWNSELDYTSSSGALITSNTSDSVFIKDLYVDNNSGAGYTQLIGSAKQYIYNLKMDVPAQQFAGIRFGESVGIIDGALFTGVNGSTRILATPAGVIDIIINNIIFDGAIGDTNYILSIADAATVSNIINSTGSAVNAIFYNEAQVSNMSSTGSGSISVLVNGDNGNYSNCYLDGGTITMYNDKCSFTNIAGIGTLDMTSANSTDNNFTNCRVTSAITIAGDRNRISNSALLGGVSISSGADDNSIIGSQGGADAGGGVLTITVAAGANRTRLVGNMTDAAISDAGTGTEMSSNTVY